MTQRLVGDGAHADHVGGKAMALDRLIAAGLPVPPCGVVTAAAYQAATADEALAALLAELQSAPVPEPSTMSTEAARVDEAFAAVEVPPAVEQSIVELAERVAGRDGRLAVRSSATVEDSSGASFAGQFRSLLEVELDAVLEAVRQVWASLWHPAPRSYRHARAIDETDLAMAVVLMRMVPATRAGVAFTVDPEGDDDSVRVEWVTGLGEKLVSGVVTPERVLVPRRGDGGVAGDDLAVEVRDLALRAEAVLGGPQDVEWAAADGDVYIVQSRPITVMARGAGTEPTWTPVPVEEIAPGVLSPLLWSLNGPALEEGFRRLFDQLGVDLPDQPIVARFAGRVAANLDALADAVSSLPGGSRAELERQYFGRSTASDDEGGRPPAVARLVAASRAGRLRRRLGHETATVQRAVDLVIDADVVVDVLEAGALVAYRRRLHDLLMRVVAAQVAAAANAVAAYRALETHLARLIGDDAPAVAQRLTAGALRADVRSALDASAIVELVGADVLDAALGDADDLEALQRRLEAHGEPGSMRVALAWARRRAGSTGIPGGPTWDEHDDLTLEALRSGRADPGTGTPDPAEALAAFEHELTSTWRWRLQRLLTGQLVDVRRRVLRQLVDDATRLLGDREQLKLTALRLGGESRRTARRAAELLHAAGRLPEVDDIELLSDAELRELLTGGPVPADLAVRRCAQQRDLASEPLPVAFIGDPSRPALIDGPDADAATAGEVLRGWAASAGRHRGRAVVVDDAAASTLEEGDVLIAHATDPSWTPLFVRAGAIVVEEGGPLSHAAIVARELGKPAVLNVPGIVDRLRDDAGEVTVDGTDGTVVMHEVGP